MLTGETWVVWERNVKSGGCWVQAEDSSRVWLTPREMDMLDRVALGLQSSDIARQLFVSEKTVKAHLSGAMRKLGAHTRTRAAVLYVLASPQRSAARFGPQASPPGEDDREMAEAAVPD